MQNYFDYIGGVALMLYGIRTLRKGSDRLFGGRLRRLIQSATNGRLRSLFAGVSISILMPSSTAVALLSVEAIVAGYVTFQQMLAFMLGANIGFTITVHLLAFKFYAFNTLFIAFGVPLFLFGRRPLSKGAGQVLLGLGFLLLSMQVLSNAVTPLRTSVEVKEIMQVLENHPMWIVLFTMLLTQCVQSSTATIGIAIALSAQQMLPLSGAIAAVIGANIGTAMTGLIAGYARVETKRLAIGNLFFKLVGAAVCLPFLPGIVNALQRLMPNNDPLVIATAHSIFNLTLAVCFLPILSPVARLVKKLVPARPDAEKAFGPRYLDPASLGSPALALGQVTREALHMADRVQTMLHGAHEAFKVTDPVLCKHIQQQDDQVDVLNNEIKAHLTKLSGQGLTAEESDRAIAVLVFATELENIGDIIDKNLMELARKRIALQIEFSPNGWSEIEALFQKVDENLEIAVSAFASWDHSLAEKLLRHKHYVNGWERDLRNRHFRRLHDRLIESIATSAVHLDVLTNLKRINSHLSAVAYLILNETKPGLPPAPVALQVRSHAI